MILQVTALFSLALPLAHAAETILGVYIFSRHGDRTPKALPPANLTDLGYQEIYTSGLNFRNRYVSSSASAKIVGINADIVKQSQITVQAPADTVLMNSAMGFLQGLYPPVGSSVATETLRNGSQVQAPMNGYQLIPIQAVSGGAGTGSEDSAWLQGASNCAKAQTSSNQYFSTQEYKDRISSTNEFYKTLSPLVSGTFNQKDINYANAYSVFDVLNVASIHNVTVEPSHLFTPDVLFQARTLSDIHEYNLAFNATDPIRAIAGATLAAEIVQQLNTTITSRGKNKINIQFGAYASFQSFFGLAQLPAANPDFYGIPDYAASMTFELFTTGTASPFPATADIMVRFLFNNGTAANSSELVAYPLFGQSKFTLPWSSFADGMSKFAIGSQQAWCHACGNTTGVCAASASARAGSASNSPSPSASSSSSHAGMSPAVGGVIGAMVTLVVMLVMEALALLIGGLRLVKKKRSGKIEDSIVTEGKS
ncbi:MAG: hypothetical protein M1836_003087 [Candelina mexicana]|nr:MAG: hypothetical protein M1836_003087 [Candelina mexicana]